MKPSGEPERAGEVLHQAGATATAVETADGELRWQVRRHRDNTVTGTKLLAHGSHWQPEHRWPDVSEPKR